MSKPFAFKTVAEVTEMIVTMRDRLVIQGKQSLSERGLCVYRGPNGLKCAIGQIMPDSNYDPFFDKNALDIYANQVAEAIGVSPADGSIIMILDRAQSIHDIKYLSDEAFIAGVKTGFDDLIARIPELMVTP